MREIEREKMMRENFEREFERESERKRYPIMIEYINPIRFGDLYYYYDLIIFDSEEEKERYMMNEKSYDYFDNMILKNENERIYKS